jgi:hypothetical protein
MNGFRELQPGVYTRIDPEEIRERLRAVDGVILDVDECLLPGFSQIHVGHQLFRHLLREAPRRPGRLPQLVRMATLGVLLYFIKSLPLPPERRNRWLHLNFNRALRGITENDLAAVVPRIWHRLHFGAPECLVLLAGRTRVGIVSLGLDALLRYLPPAVPVNGGPFPFLFVEANVTEWRNGRLAGLREPVRAGPADKAELFRAAGAAHGLAVPLVVGHNRDETELCRIAEERGGLAVGIGPSDHARDHFHIVLAEGDWLALSGFLRSYWPGLREE